MESHQSLGMRSRLWKLRDSPRDKCSNRFRERRTELVARFRGINLLDTDESGPSDVNLDISVNNNQWWPTESPSNNNNNLSYDMDMDYSGAMGQDDNSDVNDNYRKFAHDDSLVEDGHDNCFASSSNNDLGPAQTIAYDPWAPTESIIGFLMNNWEDPFKMTCPYCKKYSMIKQGANLICGNCSIESPIAPDVSIKLIKERIHSSLSNHQLTCPNNFSNYAFCKTSIVLSCDHCTKVYRILDGD